MRVLAVAILAMISVSCKSTSGGHYEMRAAAFAVPTFEEDAEREEEGDDSASMNTERCDDFSVGECEKRTKSAKSSSTEKLR